ncbi:4-hydroxybenzoate octaprenyltransferase protein [Candidatus Micropelagos thuwalensis]|uniref:4-hydroxybenzoate octaprenyltransferase protein n=1 Tax=Candidatus Micropelagius thuwalensis TaxID=1397666 RepID=U2XPE9_9PROT|nr:hypothetical protein [Candidatus Micropelagos thuwalensis]ERL47022.1 4-hydroxybenzoate octaprenyltransferase protein [Candidatus Micropelagos thuwalensis]
MKHTLKTLVVTIALLFSTPAWAEWEITLEGKEGETIHVGYEPTLNENGNILYYVLYEFIDKDTGSKSFSEVLYYKGHCHSFATQAVGSTPLSHHKINGEIRYLTIYESLLFRPKPKSLEAIILREVCDKFYKKRENIKE